MALQHSHAFQAPAFLNFYGSSSRKCLRAISSIRATTVSNNGDLSSFKDWCIEKGIITPLDLDLKNDDYRFMKYSKDNERPETIDGPILRVPLKACIVAESPEALAIRLAEEKRVGDESEFAAYINVLPKITSDSLQSMPRFWSQDKLEKVSEFDGGYIYQKAMASKQKCKEMNIDEWALACVNSRANFLLDKGYAMTPVLDMLNHDFSSKTRGSILEDELFLSVDKKFEKGDEVFISYGSFSNLETLCEYGFVDSNQNPYNKEFVDVRMIRKEPVRVTIDNNGALDSGSLALLRSYLTPESVVMEKLLMDDTLTQTAVFAKPISDEIEEEVFSFIASFVDGAIYEAKEGINWAVDNNDDILKRYLAARVEVLMKGIEFMKNKFPDLIY
ncbi:hypothetical protein CTEN210_17619 [Chaetoceros tenuissimus]|uniref:SET domain-containing protein n=1 Tax=Chaetoceros tenuissimus TaxID=426638 RepID=A0AAD3HFJ7_9STRA|nr:hypothetical protein CTEN210_17619 [Chaetoceros tenuissimus]